MDLEDGFFDGLPLPIGRTEAAMAVSRRKDGIGPGRHGNDGIGCDIGIVEPGIAIGPAVVDRRARPGIKLPANSFFAIQDILDTM